MTASEEIMLTQMEHRTDARIVKTKAKLIETFKIMAQEIPFEDITVNDLCQRADIRRATFYKHYKDKYDFLRSYVTDLRDNFDNDFKKKRKPDATASYYVEYVHGIINFLTENEGMIQLAMQSNVLSVIIDIIKEQNYSDTCDRLHKSVSEGMKLCASVETIAAIMTGGVLAAILNWLKSDRKTTLESLTNEITSAVRLLAGEK